MAIPVGAIIAGVIGFIVIVGVGVGLYMIAPTARTGRFGDGELPAGMPGAVVGAPDETESSDGLVGDTFSPASDADNTDVTELLLCRLNSPEWVPSLGTCL